MVRFAHILAALVVLILSATSFAAVSDNFNDNSQSAVWSLVQDHATTLWLNETNQRLELRGNAGQPGGSSSDDALYLSNGAGGFRVSTAHDFTIRIEYSFTGFSGALGTVALDLGIGTDATGANSAAVAFTRSSVPAADKILGAAYRTGGVQTNLPPIKLNAATAGTLVIGYETATDKLTLGNGTDSATLSNLVKGTWGAGDLLVSFGGRGTGLTLASGQAYLDNFSATPEPATLAVLALGFAGILVRRRTRAA